MRAKVLLLILLSSLLSATAVSATELDLGAQARDLLSVQEDLLAFQKANLESPDYPGVVALASAVHHAHTVLVHVRDLAAILNDFDCDRERLASRIHEIVTEEALPDLKLGLEEVNLELNHMTDLSSKDAGIRARNALREAIQRIESKWPANS